MDLVTFPGDGEWLAWLREQAEGALERATGHLDRMRAGATGLDALHAWNDAAIETSNAHAATSLLSAVHPDPALRELAEELEAKVESYLTDMSLDPSL